MRRLSIPAAAGLTFVAVYQLVPARGAEDAAAGDSPAAESVYYSGCNAARAAGAAPIYRGQPGYREEMDGDGDGIACEPHRGRGW
jgi:hypothetical protein